MSMAAHARAPPARDGAKCARMWSAIELLAAAQGCDFHAAACGPAQRWKRVREALRAAVPHAGGRPAFRPRHAACDRHGRVGRRRGDGRRRRAALGRGTRMSGAPAPAWLDVVRGDAPLLVSIPHTGTRPRRARAAPRLALAGPQGCRLVDRPALRFRRRPRRHRGPHGHLAHRHRRQPRPSGASLYPGQATTELCPATTFDGEPLYRPGRGLDPAEVALRRARFFDPYHAALRPRWTASAAKPLAIVVYDCHSIRSVIPRLFEGTLPHFNLGTNGGTSCAPALTREIEGVLCGRRRPVHPRHRRALQGGFITRSLGRPAAGVHAVQMELACRGYMADPGRPYARDMADSPRQDGLRPPADHPPGRAPIRPVLRPKRRRSNPMSGIDDARTIRAADGTKTHAGP